MRGVEVRKPEQLLGLDSLIIPGGESTTMAKLANCHNLVGGSVCFCSPPLPLSSLWLIASSITSLVTWLIGEIQGLVDVYELGVCADVLLPWLES